MRLPRTLLLVLTCVVTPCLAADFRAGNVEGLFDLRAAYGVGIRVEDVDEDLVAIANGGTRTSANNDDGDLNYDRGIMSNAVRLNADLTLAWRDFGVYVRGYAQYDYENQDVERAIELLQVDLPEPLAGDNWVCAACSTEVEAVFNCCWSCGAERDNT